MASPKNRDYFITINQSANCYEEALEILENLNTKVYAFIVHDKDCTEDGEIKPTHKHIMLELKNPISFESMQNKFQGAHIEVPRYKKNAYQYLLHESPNSKDKYQYAFEEIITNQPELVKIYIEANTFELFLENMYLQYIAQGVNTPFRFVQRFGLNAFKQYWNTYSFMISQLQSDEEMKAKINEIKATLEKSNQLEQDVSEEQQESRDLEDDDELPF